MIQELNTEGDVRHKSIFKTFSKTIFNQGEKVDFSNRRFFLSKKSGKDKQTGDAKKKNEE